MKLTINYVTLLLALLFSACGNPAAKQIELYIGTYTAEGSEGVYRVIFDNVKGIATAPELMVSVDNPSYLAFSPDNVYLYAVSQGKTNETSALNAFAVKADGKLSPLSRHATGSAGPCYVRVAGDYVYTANYLGGSVSVFPIAQDGSTKETVHIEKFEGDGDVAHLHGLFDAPGRKLYATDLGLDNIYLVDPVIDTDNTYHFNILSTIQLPDGFGPRHLATSVDASRLYVLGELSGEVAVFDTEKQPFKLLQLIPSDSVGGCGCADIHLSPDGRFLYASNRLKEDGISTFAVDSEGLLTKIDYTHTGIHPRNFIISPDGRWLLCANRDSDNIQIFERDLESGRLTNTGREISLSMPVCLVWKN